MKVGTRGYNKTGRPQEGKYDFIPQQETYSYLRSSEHHPQKGSWAARHSSQLVYRPHSDTGNFVTCSVTFTDNTIPTGRNPTNDYANGHFLRLPGYCLQGDLCRLLEWYFSRPYATHDDALLTVCESIKSNTMNWCSITRSERNLGGNLRKPV